MARRQDAEDPELGLASAGALMRRVRDFLGRFVVLAKAKAR
jgi:hypothetical protein